MKTYPGSQPVKEIYLPYTLANFFCIPRLHHAYILFEKINGKLELRNTMDCLGLMLSCFYRHPVIKESWLFKGGTCLKKIYPKDYRFSADRVPCKQGGY